MNNIDQENYCEVLQLPPAGAAYLLRVVTGEPARRVRGGGGNVTVRYPSRKNGFVVQAESKTVELPFVLKMEYDDAVLRYFDQPESISLSYIAKSGRKTGCLHTPDFFVLRATEAEWVECKPEEELIRLSEEMPNRYRREPGGRWQCPPGEEVAAQFGFKYRVVSSAEVDPVFTRNVIFLADYFNEPGPEAEAALAARLVEVVRKKLGVSIKELLDAVPDAPPELVYSLIGRAKVYVDLSRTPVMDWANTYLFGTAELSAACQILSAATTHQTVPGVLLAIGAELAWLNRRYIVVNYNSEVVVLDSEGTTIQLNRTIVDGAIASSEITQVSGVSAPMQPRLIEATLAASPEELKGAFDRLKVLQGNDTSAGDVTQRTLDRWKKDFREAEAIYGAGFLGLLPKIRKRGNRLNRFSDEVYALADVVIRDEYLSFKQKRKLPVYAAFQQRCMNAGFSTPSYQWFCERIRELDQYEVTLQRKGKRAAYSLERRHEQANTQRTCDRPFERVHIDHTQVDIQLVSSSTDRALGRPWLTLAIDECTRRVLAFYLSFDAPSYRSCMAIFQEMVRSHSRLPDRVVVDNGKEFSSCDFEWLAARFEMAIEKRPPAKARFGSVIERMFGTINTQLIYQLWGNTQATKTDVRTVTKSVDPARHACWTLAEFDGLVREYLFRIYDTAVHPALGLSPSDTFVRALERTGLRPAKLIPYNESFTIWCMPTTRTGMAKVQVRAGIKVNYLYYWSDDFRVAGIEGSKVRVKFDPFNAGIAYAWVKHQWVRCISEYHGFFNRRSHKEVMIASEELRKTKSFCGSGTLITAKKLRDFMAAPEQLERTKQQKAKDQERNLVENHGPHVRVETSPITPFLPSESLCSPQAPVSKLRIEQAIDI